MSRSLLIFATSFFLIPLLLRNSWPQSGGVRSDTNVWKFAVSGDSRNCGDVVMPTIAESVRRHKAEFYWHLGDLRAMYGVDEDMQKLYNGKLGLDEYRQIAWGDFISNQITPFGSIPFRLGIGNHEVTGGKTKADFVKEFDYWLDAPELRAQRLRDNPLDTQVKTYFHWRQHNVDFIYLDNASDEDFDDAQVTWFEQVLKRDEAENDVKTVVVAMHRALPNSLACGHSMNGDLVHPSANGTKSGRRAYIDLVNWQKQTKKHVYVLASHSHFYMRDLFDTEYWRNPAHGGEVLPGWIVGTAGARRYALPELSPEMKQKTDAQTFVWGYLLATVETSGEIHFDFIKLDQQNVPTTVRSRYGDDFVNFCFAENKDESPHPPPPSCAEK